MDAIHKLSSFDLPPQSVVLHVVALVLTALLLIALTSRHFRYQ